MVARKNRIGVRNASAEDAEFLVDILLDSANQQRPEPLSRRQLLKNPEFAPYVAGWQRDGDVGVIAIDLSGPAGLQIPVGAAWLRRFSSAHPGNAYISNDVPEVAVGVVDQYRERGIEVALLKALLTRSAQQPFRKVSAAALAGSPELKWFKDAGFTSLTRSESMHTLIANVK